MAEILNLTEEYIPMLCCPDCDCEAWCIVVDKYSTDYKVTEFRCLECGLTYPLDMLFPSE